VVKTDDGFSSARLMQLALPQRILEVAKSSTSMLPIQVLDNPNIGI
jgi:hypothetical protein